jgi:hypothetical protein
MKTLSIIIALAFTATSAFAEWTRVLQKVDLYPQDSVPLSITEISSYRGELFITANIKGYLGIYSMDEGGNWTTLRDDYAAMLEGEEVPWSVYSTMNESGYVWAGYSLEMNYLLSVSLDNASAQEHFYGQQGTHIYNITSFGDMAAGYDGDSIYLAKRDIHEVMKLPYESEGYVQGMAMDDKNIVLLTTEGVDLLSLETGSFGEITHYKVPEGRPLTQAVAIDGGFVMTGSEYKDGKYTSHYAYGISPEGEFVPFFENDTEGFSISSLSQYDGGLIIATGRYSGFYMSTGGDEPTFTEYPDGVTDVNGSVYMDERFYFTTAANEVWVYDPLSSVEGDETTGGPLFYPNPANTNITITQPGGSDIMIYDMKGRQVASGDQNTNELYVGGLMPGIYRVVSGGRSEQLVVE